MNIWFSHVWFIFHRQRSWELIIQDLYQTTRQYGLYLFMDGARLGSALALPDAPTLEEIAKNVDAFYIGGTKMGALFGEALVIIHDD